MVEIRVEGITKKLRESQVLGGASLVVADGEFAVSTAACFI